MTAPFQVYGPLELQKTKIAEPKYQKERWKIVEESYPKLSTAKGVYLISLRNGSNYKPVYVGITNKQSFKLEVFNPANIAKILHSLSKTKGTLCLHLLAKRKPHHAGYSRNISKKTLAWVELFLLFVCRQKNPHMLNKSHTTFLNTVEIDKVTKSIGQGAHSFAIRTFKNALDF